MRNIHQVINSLKRCLDPCLISDLEQGEGRGTQEGRRSSALFPNFYLYESEGVVQEKCWGVGILLIACTSTNVATCSVRIRGSYLSLVFFLVQQMLVVLVVE